MKKTLIGLIFICSLQLIYAQKSEYNTDPKHLFNQGKEMYLNSNYSGTVNTLEQFIVKSTNKDMNEEAEFMILASEFYMGTSNILTHLKEYLDKYPSTSHRGQLALYIGSIYFQAKKWQKAVDWLSQTNPSSLTVDESYDHAYRLAYAYLQSKQNISEAKKLFGNLMRNSDKYSEPASYYFAYIDFQDGNYRQASTLFRQLMHNPEYVENVTFYLIQASFLDGDIDKTISAGKSFITTYPRSENAPEVFRLLGNCYYQKSDMVNCVINYERYLQSASDIFPIDMYQLADAYYQNRAYPQSIQALKMVASPDDVLGQAAYMLLGQAYLKSNNDANALIAFDAASRSNFDPSLSEDAFYNYVLILSKGSVSTFDESITAFQRFLREYKNSKYTSDINGLLAKTLLSTKNYSAALEIIENLKSPSRHIYEAKQMILTQRGIQEYINQNYSSALDDFGIAILMGNYNRDALNAAYFWRGEVYYNNGEFSKAIEDYTAYLNNALPSRKNYPLALYSQGYAYFQLKKYDQSRANFKRYITAEKDKKSQTYADAMNRIGDTYLSDRNFSEAENYYSQAQTARSGSSDYAEYQKALVKGLQHDNKEKISLLDKMMERYPDSHYYDNALKEKADALISLGREEQAIPVLDNLLRVYPQSSIAPQAGMQIGQLYFNLNKPQKSIAAYKHVISSYPNTEEARLSIKSLEGVYKELNDISGYAAYMNSLGGAYRVTTLRQDSLTYMAAEDLFLKDKLVQAKTAFSKYLQSYPSGVYSGDAHYNLGVIAYQSKDKATALTHFNQAIKLNNSKHLDDALIYASGIEFDNKNYDVAYSFYKHLGEATNNSGNRSIADLGMLRCAYLTHRDNEVISSAQQILSENKVSAAVANEARFYRGRSLSNLNRFDEGMKDLKEVAKDTRSSFGSESQYILAQNYYDKGMLDAAEKQITDDFMKKGTTHHYWMARALIVLSDVYVSKGDYFMARQYLENLQTSYKGDQQDIKQMVSQRLSKLNGVQKQ